jgi:hypothetical protein
MRTFTSVVLLGTFLSPSVWAGSLTMKDGQVSWQPSQCAVPEIPKEFINLGTFKKADDLNTLVLKYNLYVAEAQAAMHCLSSEAEHDANKANYTIEATAKEKIDRLESAVNRLGDVLKNAEK